MLIPIGGFLGAGKTSLLARAAQELATLGCSVGVITNDQAEGLVDTAALNAAGLRVAEVAGGCFCCKFPALERAVAELGDLGPSSVVLAEPVGSCTDLAATVVRPWRAVLGRPTAALSVLVDEPRIAQAIDPVFPGPLPSESAYIMRKQLEEADAIVLSKVDLMDGASRGAASRRLRAAFPGREIFETSAVTGEGVARWVRYVLSSTQGGYKAGERRIDVDYDIYARGEAVLGWMNAEGTARVAPFTTGTGALAEPKDPGAALCTAILEEFRRACADAGGEIAHVKVRVEGRGSVQGHLLAADAAAIINGRCSDGDARLILNARVAMEPGALQAVAEEALSRAGGVKLSRAACFSPGRPVPTHRI